MGKGEFLRLGHPDTALPATEDKILAEAAGHYQTAECVSCTDNHWNQSVNWTCYGEQMIQGKKSASTLPSSMAPTPGRVQSLNRHLSAVERLAAEIHAFENYTSPSKEEHHAADYACQDLVEFIKEMGDGLVVDIIGSRATSLADPLSDLDINVSHPHQRQASHASMEKSSFNILRDIHNSLRKSSSTIGDLSASRIQVHHFVREARVPLIQCYHRATALPIQIQSTPRTYDSREYVKAALQEYPSLRGLFKVFKQILQMRGLTIGSSGGITSYPLFQMIVAALKLSGGRYYTADVGHQFLYILDFYSDFDFSKQGLITEPFAVFSKAVRWARNLDEEMEEAQNEKEFGGQVHPHQRAFVFRNQNQGKLRSTTEHLMTLQDPASPINDLGRSCWRILDVQETFITLRAEVKRAMAEWDHLPRRSTGAEGQFSLPSLLEPCVGGDYRIYEQERDDLRTKGQTTRTNEAIALTV